MIRGLWQFIVAAGFIGSGSVVLAIVLFVVAAFEHARDKNVSANVFLLIGCLAFCQSAFRAWQIEHNLVKVKSTEVEQLSDQIQGLARSSIAAEVDFAIVGSQPTGSSAGLVVTLTNTGAEAAVLPGSWHFQTSTTDGRKFEGYPITLSNKNLDFCFPPRTVRRFVLADALYLKTSHPIPRNGYSQGFLWFAIPDMPHFYQMTIEQL